MEQVADVGLIIKQYNLWSAPALDRSALGTSIQLQHFRVGLISAEVRVSWGALVSKQSLTVSYCQRNSLDKLYASVVLSQRFCCISFGLKTNEQMGYLKLLGYSTVLGASSFYDVK